MRQLLVAVAAIIIVACAPPSPKPTAPEIWVYLSHACVLDSGQVYVEVGFPQSGWFSISYADGQQTEWAYYYGGSTHVSLHAATDFQVYYSTEDLGKGGDDGPYIPSGGTFHVFGQPRCPQKV